MERDECLDIMAVQELLGGAFLRMDQGDPDGALSCALQALRLSGEAPWRATQERALEVCHRILQQGGILVERGRAAELKEALKDGSSVVCTRCGAMVAWARAEAHRTEWCPSLDEGPWA